MLNIIKTNNKLEKNHLQLWENQRLLFLREEIIFQKKKV